MEFVYDLDYEKYMEDYEVRQALAIIKDRVTEIKKDEDWKENIAEEWNQATEQEHNEGKYKKQRAPDERSVFSYKSGVSKTSKASFKSRVDSEKNREQETKSQWNGSITSSKRGITTEDRIAAKIANEVLRDNAKLRGVHSGASIKKILEKEAKKHLMANGGKYEGPLISTIHERGEVDPANPSNLPYLNKNPAV